MSETARQNSLIFMSLSKAFNMPGVASSYCIIENDQLRHQFQEFIEASEFSERHLFAYLTVAPDYSNGTEWIDQPLACIQGNIDLTDSFLKAYVPSIKVIRPQAFYPVFFYCRELRLSQKELVHLLIDCTHFSLNDGAIFGIEGQGFMRLNVACSRNLFEQALQQ